MLLHDYHSCQTLLLFEIKKFEFRKKVVSLAKYHVITVEHVKSPESLKVRELVIDTWLMCWLVGNNVFYISQICHGFFFDFHENT